MNARLYYRYNIRWQQHIGPNFEGIEKKLTAVFSILIAPYDFQKHNDVSFLSSFLLNLILSFESKKNEIFIASNSFHPTYFMLAQERAHSVGGLSPNIISAMPLWNNLKLVWVSIDHCIHALSACQ